MIAMMQATQPWHRYDPAIHTELARCLTASRGALPQREVCAVVVIVTDVLVHQAFQMPFIHDERMVDQIPAAVANPALGYAVLPRTSEAGPLGMDAEALHCVEDFSIELCTMIED
jgi:hypothetical protein